MTAPDRPHSPAPLTTRMIFARATMHAFEKARQRRAARSTASGSQPRSRYGRAWHVLALPAMAAVAAWLILG